MRCCSRSGCSEHASSAWKGNHSWSDSRSFHRLIVTVILESISSAFRATRDALRNCTMPNRSEDHGDNDDFPHGGMSKQPVQAPSLILVVQPPSLILVVQPPSLILLAYCSLSTAPSSVFTTLDCGLNCPPHGTFQPRSCNKYHIR